MIQLLTDSFRRLLKMFMLANYPGVKVVGIWKRTWDGNTFSKARHFCNLAFQGLKERFFRENARSQAGKTVLSITNELVNLHLVKISA